MRKYWSLFFVSILLSCSSGKSIDSNYFVVDYSSDKLCNGIHNLTEYVVNSEEINDYFVNATDDGKLRIKIDILVTESVPNMFFKAEVQEKIKQEEKISPEQAYKLLELRSIRTPIIKLKNCIKDSNVVDPHVELKFYYYSEYGLLIADISKIKYKPEYGKGFLVLAELDSVGSIKIIKTSHWQE